MDEIPEFIRMQEKLGNQGLQFVGIAIDDRIKVREFALKYHMNYPVLIGEMGAIELVRIAGNEHGGLPFTVIVDRRGRLIGRELGGLNEQKLTAIIQPAM
jgi:peroxiredoxin